MANNYGPPYGSAEENFGEILRNDFRNHRSHLNVCGRRVDLQFRIIGCPFLPFASDFAESNEYQADEGQPD
jgi:hypothetical protein